MLYHVIKCERLTSIAIWSSWRMSWSEPMSSHLTSGTVAKPSLLAEGCTTFRAAWKSSISMNTPEGQYNSTVLQIFHDKTSFIYRMTREGPILILHVTIPSILGLQGSARLSPWRQSVCFHSHRNMINNYKHFLFLITNRSPQPNS